VPCSLAAEFRKCKSIRQKICQGPSPSWAKA
jgi:hypothetical protein